MATFNTMTKTELRDALLNERAKVRKIHGDLAETICDLRQLGWESTSHKDKLVFLSLARRLQETHNS